MFPFQSTHSLRSATGRSLKNRAFPGSFNPRTPCGVRRKCQIATEYGKSFQSTHSLRSATGRGWWPRRWRKFQSTHSLRSATKEEGVTLNIQLVSIHALLAECDSMALISLDGCRGFNPRTPCGVRPPSSSVVISDITFQSTHSLRSATVQPDGSRVEKTVSIHALLAECDRGAGFPRFRRPCFNPRTPCGVRPLPLRPPFLEGMFQSTHSLRSATHDEGVGPVWGAFQSTHSLRSATFASPEASRYGMVSIHALLAECDPVRGIVKPAGQGFNPRTPCGVRPNALGPSTSDVSFQSTHSLRSATRCRNRHQATR